MIKNNLKLITIITLIFFSSFGVKAEKLTSLEQIMKEDDPKHLSYVMMRCASLQLVLSFLPSDNIFSSEVERFLTHSTMSVEIFNTISSSHAANTGISLKEAKKLIGEHLFKTSNLYLEEMDTDLRNPLENTPLNKDWDVCIEMIMALGLNNSKYFNNN